MDIVPVVLLLGATAGGVYAYSQYAQSIAHSRGSDLVVGDGGVYDPMLGPPSMTTPPPTSEIDPVGSVPVPPAPTPPPPEPPQQQTLGEQVIGIFVDTLSGWIRDGVGQSPTTNPYRQTTTSSDPLKPLSQGLRRVFSFWG